MARKFSAHYSGKRSIGFWDGIWEVPEPDRKRLYSLGCHLQNLEEKMLERLRAARRKYRGKLLTKAEKR